MQFKFDKKMIFLAPMAGITDDAFRTICKEQGCDVICCEMVSDYAVYYNNKKTLKMLEYDKEQRPISIQIFGEDSEKMVAAAKFIETNAKPDIIDINMGCPAKKVAVSKEAGSALLKDINKVELIAKSVINSLKTPVSVKIRSG
jgi:tRNA-dihydrouridine synthase